MRPPSSAVISGLAITASATLLAGLVSAFAVGGGSTTHAASSASSTTTEAPATTESTIPGAGVTTTAPVKPGQPGQPAPTTTSKTPLTSATTSAPLPPAAGPVGDPGQPTAETPGTYTYSFTAASGSDTQSGTINEKVQTTSSAGGVTKQTVVDSGNQNFSQNRMVEWRPAGLYEIQHTFMFNGQSGSCTWNPPIQELASPLSVGKQWTLSGTCQVTIYGQPLTIKLNGKASVTKKERLKVGADAVDVWVISAMYDAVASSPTIGSFTVHNDAVDRVAARLGLLVEEDATQTTTSSRGSANSHTHQEVKSIHPVS